MEDFLILDAGELHRTFDGLGKVDKHLKSEFYVTSSIKKEVQCGVDQGRVTIEGKVYQIVFENDGGGVWVARLGIIGKTNKG